MGGGKPAARQGDMTRKGLDIVQGSAGVLIGAPTGVACSVCPGGITYANPVNPVNPVLGAKVLPGETDLALPCPLPFILFRAYSSYRTRTPAPVGVFGPGWKAPFDIRLQIRDEGLILNDSGGRSIHFEPLFPGEISYSRSESLWLARGGVAAQHSSQPLSALWQVLPEDVRLSPHVYLATNSLQGPWWILSWPERVPGADEVLPPEPPAYRVLTGVVDGFGRTLAFHRAAEGDVAGAVKFATAIRNHWHVENKLHWRLDVVMNEDDCKIRRGNAAELFSGIRHITINILTNDKVFKAGLRRKMRKAAMDRNYLASVLAGSGLS
ncbi:rhs core protein with extension [Shigella sonnei]|nr:rhs core protein with extension [Shigella sonnei]